MLQEDLKARTAHSGNVVNTETEDEEFWASTTDTFASRDSHSQTEIANRPDVVFILPSHANKAIYFWTKTSPGFWEQDQETH